MANAYGFLFLPDENVVHHCAAAENDAETDQNAGDDCRRRMELGECVEDDAWNMDGYVNGLSERIPLGYSPVRKIGIDMKKPPTAQIRLTLDFCRYLLVLRKDA